MQKHVHLIENRENILVAQKLCRQSLRKRRVEQLRLVVQLTNGSQSIQVDGAIDHVRVLVT